MKEANRKGRNTKQFIRKAINENIIRNNSNMIANQVPIMILCQIHLSLIKNALHIIIKEFNKSSFNLRNKSNTDLNIVNSTNSILFQEHKRAISINRNRGNKEKSWRLRGKN